MKRDDMSKAASPSSPEGGRRPTGGDEGEARAKKFFAKHKTQAVLRILRGEPMEIVSRDIGATASVLSSWRDSFLASGTQGFAKKTPAQEGETKRLNAKIGELSMENELLREKIARMEQNRPFAVSRSKR